MSIPPPLPPHPSSPGSLAESEAPGKAVHIAGAGTIGMVLLIASLSMLFLASVVALLVIRSQQPQWPPAGMPLPPKSLWLSTAVILMASVTIQLALSAIHRDQEKALFRWLGATFVIGVLFLGMQSYNWWEFYDAIRRNNVFQGAYLGMFFVLTGLHAAHVIGGLIPLGVVMASAKKGRYSRNFHPGVRYVTVYWHFLDIVWIMLVCVLYF